MDREKLIKQLLVGKVADIIGNEKAIQLLKEATVAVDDCILNPSLQLNKSNWRMISKTESPCGNFMLIHHSTSSLIQLKIKNPDENNVWFNYQEWESFLGLIKGLV